MEGVIERSYYSEDSAVFIEQKNEDILGKIQTKASPTNPTNEQSKAWAEQIRILKELLSHYSNCKNAFEYTIPRVGKRVDSILLINNIVFILEFKCALEEKPKDIGYPKQAIDQVYDYALDLKFFHKESENRLLVPILVCTKSADVNNEIIMEDYRILKPFRCNENNIAKAIDSVLEKYPSEPFLDTEKWMNSEYCPVPTVIEAAKALYAHHSVKEITRHDANIDETTTEINHIIDYSKTNRCKSICFVTGVPGSGKTLVGLNIAISRTEGHGDHATYLSGNGPLVEVLVTSLIRDFKERRKERGLKTNDKEVKEKVIGIRNSIQIVHRYRDYYKDNDSAPNEHIAIFDEAQRAWTKEKIQYFMMTKKNHPNFPYSEPEFLIETMNRHRDWATVVCLVGGGQEIYDGEAGLPEWFDSLRRSFKDWEVFVSPKLNDSEYCRNRTWNDIIKDLKIHERKELHLSTSIRSFRTPYISSFVKSLLDLDKGMAKEYLNKIGSRYPIYITRDLNKAREYVKNKSKGTTRYGIIASSKAMRLKPSGLFIKSSNNIVHWILGEKDDVRSSYYLEEAVTEFDIQGLEIDYSIVAWDADLRYVNGEWKYHYFRGSKWVTIQKEDNKLFLKNAYRVLLTRARQGMVIFVPEGNDEDYSRQKEYYDGTYQYLIELGIPLLK